MDEYIDYCADEDDYYIEEEQEAATSENTVQIDVENLYYKADTNKSNDPEDSLDQLRRCIELAEKSGQKNYVFRCYILIVMIKIDLQKRESEIKSDLLECFREELITNKVECSDAINRMIDRMSKLYRPEDRNELLRTALDALSKLSGFETLSCQIMIRLCQLAVDKDDWDTFNRYYSVIDHLRPNIGCLSIEVKVLEVTVCALPAFLPYPRPQRLLRWNNLDDVDLILREVNLKEIVDSRILCVLFEGNGRIALRSQNWSLAYQYLFQSFQSYIECGAYNKARDLFLIILILSITANIETDPCLSKEAEPFLWEQIVQEYAKFRQLYISSRIEDFLDVLEDPKSRVRQSPIVQTCKWIMIDQIRVRWIQSAIGFHRTLSLIAVAKVTRMSLFQTFNLLKQLIEYHQLDAKIDLVDGCVCKSEVNVTYEMEVDKQFWDSAVDMTLLIHRLTVTNRSPSA